MGYAPYSISSSNRDVRADNSCLRNFYFSKDLTMQHRADPMGKTHAIKLVDVDYYLDMPTILAMFKPIFMYTFVPTSLGGSLKDATFYIHDNQVITNVNGGAMYIHKIWDYESDVLQADFWWGSVVYLVEQQVLDNQRRLIFLNPSRKIYGPFAWCLPGKRLERKTYLFGKTNILRTQRVINDQCVSEVHLAANGSRSACSLSEEIFSATKIRCDLAKEPSISDVERIFRAHEIPKPDLAAALFIQVYREDKQTLNSQTGVLSTPCKTDTFSYQTLRPLVMEDGKVVGRSLFKPILDSGFIPRKSYNNDVACIEGRIERPRNLVKTVPPFYHKCREEFMRFLIPERLAHTFVPYDEAYVEAQQNRPTQRALAARAKPFSFLHKFVVSSFQKAEVYGKVNFPRNISTVPTDHKLRFSGFTYALADVLKTTKWYAFGLNPAQITEAVRDLTSRQLYLTTNDFSNYDGSHGEFKTSTDMMIFMRAFAPPYHMEVSKLLSSMTNAPAFTNHGVFYNTGHTVLSGAASTSVCNTIMNALIAYIALRVSGFSPRDSYENLGLYGGDDNVNRCIPPETHMRVASKLGYVLKTENVDRGQPLSFLGRIFLDPWTTKASVCDVPRRLRNLHLTVVPSIVPKAVVLRRRAQSYLINDPNTPIITHWAKMILRATTTSDEGFETELRAEQPWFCDPVNNWVAPTPDEHGFALSYIAYKLQVDPSELMNLIRAIKTCNKLEGPGLELRSTREVSVEAAINGSIIGV
nr:MAG: RNA-dependent RNA polymerase [Crogonang virus 45]